MLVALGAALASIATPASAATHEVIGRSVDGRPIHLYRVGDPEADRRVLVVGCVHGDECAAYPVIGRLVNGPPVPGVELWIVPTVNPDGRARGTRGNARRVDLNRNFPVGWKPIPRTSRYFSGDRPMSEPESIIVRDLVARARPQLSIWFHQPERNVRDPRSSQPARRYARLVGLPFLPLKAPPGAITTWSTRAVAGSEAFVVELGAGALRPGLAAAHVRVVRAVARP